MQTPKTLLMHLDDGEACTAHALLAERLAERFDAQVQALYAVTPSVARHPTVAVEGAWAAANELVKLDQEQRAATRARFLAATRQLKQVHWIERPADTAWEFPLRALHADLVLMRPLEQGHTEVPHDFAATVAIESGRPVLLLPNDPSLHHLGDNVLIAWKPTREAARAVAASLPWLCMARRVHVACGSPHESEEAPADFSIEHYLHAHGVPCAMLPRIADTRDAAPALMTLARDVAADLLVMGCFGHSRTREWVLGGTTRSILQTLDLPVLMAH